MSADHRRRSVGTSGATTQVRPGITPEPDHRSRSASAGNPNHVLPPAGKKGARQSSGQRSHPSAPSLIAASSSNLADLLPGASLRNWTAAGSSGPVDPSRTAIVMQIGCWTPWNTLVLAAG
jgi:hypothetical protein